jgi:hypothetical protein
MGLAGTTREKDLHSRYMQVEVMKGAVKRYLVGLVKSFHIQIGLMML